MENQWKTNGKRENTIKNEWENQKTLAKTKKREKRENTIKNEWEMRKNEAKISLSPADSSPWT